MPSPPPTDSPEARAVAIARRLYGFRPTGIVRPPGENNDVFRVEFGGLAAKVVKLGRRTKPVLHEQAVLRQLSRPRWGMPVPSVEFTQADLPETWEQEGRRWHRPAAVSVLQWVEGMSLRDAALRGEPWVGEAFGAAGALLASLGEIPAMVLPKMRRTLPDGQIRRGIESVREVAGRLDFGDEAFEAWSRCIAAVRSAPWVSLVHGEPFSKQFLARPTGGGVSLTLLDWETARPGDPRADLAALLSSFDLWSGFSTGDIAVLRRRALDGYAARRPFADGDEVALRAWRVHACLHGARHLVGRNEERALRLVAIARQVWAREML